MMYLELIIEETMYTEAIPINFKLSQSYGAVKSQPIDDSAISVNINTIDDYLMPLCKLFEVQLDNDAGYCKVHTRNKPTLTLRFPS